MVEVRFISKKGKKFGPYYYHTYRENGKIKKEYIGSEDDYRVWKNKNQKNLQKVPSFHFKKDFRELFSFSRFLGSSKRLHSSRFLKTKSSGFNDKRSTTNWKLLVIPIIIFLVIISLFSYLNYRGISGHAILEIQNTYFAGENITGDLKLVLKSGELLPADTKIVVEQSLGVKEFLLSDFFNLTSGEYYAEGFDITGKGDGVGFIGEKKIYPDVSFTLLLSENPINETTNNETSNINNETSNTPNITNETSGEGSNLSEEPETSPENQSQEPQITENQTQETITTPETPTEPTTPTQEPISPEITAETPIESVAVETPSEVPSQSPITGTVILQNEQEIEGVVSFNKSFDYNLGELFYSIKHGSVRSEFENLTLFILESNLEDNNLKITTNYSYNQKGFGKDYLGNENELKLSLDRLNLTAENGTLIIRLVYGENVLFEQRKEIDVRNLSLEENMTIINKTGNETLKRYNIVINRQVKWQKKITVENLSEISVELPKEAENITVKTGEDIVIAEQQAQQEENIIEENKTSLISGNVVLNSEKKGILYNIWENLFGSLTGNVIEDVGNIIDLNDTKTLNIDLNESTSEVLVEYTTPGPVAIESNWTNNKKNITISATSELNYSDILAYFQLDNKIPINDKTKIKIYHIVNSSREETSFESYDLDNDGNIDYVEWIVPHLSEQVYEIIYITKAEHLDSNRSFVSDIYPYVKTQDNNWSEEIPVGDYIRVTFEKNLTNLNDITIFARANDSAEISVYREGSDEEIARFTNIANEELYKIYLTNLSDGEEYDIFDLKIQGNPVSFDYIVDPATGTPNINEPSFFMGQDTRFSAFGADGGEFDDVPISLNDYGDTSEKCNQWDCNAWTGGTADLSYKCRGGAGNIGWSVTNWYGVSPLTYNCTGTWTSSPAGDNHACIGFYDCTNWSVNNVCQNWNCTTWDVTAATLGDSYCSGSYNCTEWYNGNCDKWNCTAWTFYTGDDDDYHCTSGYNCTKWDTTNTKLCDTWMCNTWTITTVDRLDKFCSGGWNCTGITNGACNNWNCITWSEVDDGGIDEYCDKWNCSTWDLTNNICTRWNCTTPQRATTQLDYYCSGGFSCTDWRAFDSTYPQFSNYLDNNGTLFGSGTSWFNVTVANTNGTVFLSINGANYSASNLTANVYNVSISNLPSGTYSYDWSSYGNGTNHNYNISETRSYTILGNTLDIWDETKYGRPFYSVDVPVNSPVIFYANFTNYTNNPALNANCNLSVNVSGAWPSYNMTYDSSKFVYSYNYTGLANGTYKYNITCNSSEGEVKRLNSTITVPFGIYNISFKSPTPDNDTYQSELNVLINVSIIENTTDSTPIQNITYNWNGTNFTFYNRNLLLMYNFNNLSSLGENDTFIKDLSIYGNNGTAKNGAYPNITNGVYGGSYSFDGINDYINTTYNLQQNGNFTLSLWVKGTSGGGGGYYAIGKVKDLSSTFEWWMLQIYTGGAYHYAWGGAGQVASCKFTDSSIFYTQWNNIIIVVNASGPTANWRRRIYFNGVFNSSGVTNCTDGTYSAVATTNNPLYIGAASNNSNAAINNFNGSIDEVMIWNRTFTPNEVSQLYMMNLQKRSANKWELFVNQTKNATNLLDPGTYTYQVFTNASNSNAIQTEQRTVNVGLDSVYPQFSIYLDNNGTLLDSGTAWFNATVQNTNGTVFLEINGVNYTASNLTANVYNVSINLTGGTYDYYWGSWGNGTGHNYNVSGTRSYSVNDSSTLISTCQVLSSANTVYKLISNVTSNSTCFNITANNITLNGNGYTINYSANGTVGYGVVANGVNFTSVNNAVIMEGSLIGSYNYAIYFNNSKNGSVQNNNITTSNTGGYGIYLVSSSNSNTLSSNNINISGSFSYGIHLISNSNSNTLNNNTITISNTNDRGIYLSSSSNSNISSNTITTSTSNAYGIYLASNSNSNNLNSNNINTSGSSGYGIYLVSNSNSNTLNSNTITTLNSNGRAIYLSSSSNSNISSNTITTSNTNGYGIYLNSNSNSNTLNSNNINTSGSLGYGIYLNLSSKDNSFSFMNVKTNFSNAPAFYIDSGNHNFTIKDSLLNASGNRTEFFVYNNINGGYWNFTNVTRLDNSNINVTWQSGANGTLNMKWWLDANITEGSLVAINGANVTSYDNNSIIRDSNLTGADGLARLELLEYVRNETSGTNYTYYSNYSINATKTSYANNATSVNMTTNTYLWMTLNDPIYPLFYSYWDNNATIVNSGTALFNVSINNTNGTVFLEINGVNYTATNLSSNIYNVSVLLNYDGTYNYYWGSWGNGTGHNYNVSETRSYTVNSTNSFVKFVNPTLPNATITMNSSMNVNVSLVSSVITNLTYNWNGTNYSIYDNSLVLMYNMNNYSSIGENLTKIVDVSKSSLNATCSGGTCPNWSINNGVYSGGHNYDGTNDYFDLGDVLDLANKDITISVWLKPNKLPASTYASSIFARRQTGGTYNGDYILEETSTGIVQLSYLSGGSYRLLNSTSGALGNGTWKHVVITLQNISGTYVGNVYINGVFDKQTNFTVPITSSGGTIYTRIGYQFYSSNTEYYNGSLDELMVWNRSLSADEIRNLYNSNFKKYNSTQWYYYVNQTFNQSGTYTYFASATDNIQNINSTETRILYVTDIFFPNVNLISPLNRFGVNSSNAYFVSELTDDNQLKNTTLYLWNSSGNLINSSSINISGTYNQTNISMILPYQDTFYWNYYLCDNSSNCAFYNSNFSVTFDTVYPLINFTSPTLTSGTSTTNTYLPINISISDKNLNNLVFNWNGTNCSLYDDSLVLMMNFDNLSSLGENSSYVADLSKYGNNGVVINATLNTTNCKYGNCFDMNGSGGYVAANTTPEISKDGNFTYSIWIKVKSYVNGGTTANALGSVFINRINASTPLVNLKSVDSTYGFQIRYDDNSGIGGPNGSTITGNWQHIVMIREYNVNFRLYVNGINVANTTDSGSKSLTPPVPRIGFSGNANLSLSLNGSIDEFRIYNRVLSSDEIKESYMSNLYKYNQTQWYLYINQSKNSTTGLDNGTYTYFSNVIDIGGNENFTETRTITIGTDTNAPLVYLLSPADALQVGQGNALQYFSANATDNINVKNMTLYIWNSSNSLVYNVTNTTGVISAISNFSYTFPRNDSYKWNYYACDNATTPNCAWNSTNYTLVLNYTPPTITLINTTNASGISAGTVTLGQNVIINATISGASYVWAKIWQGGVGNSIVIWQGLLNWISGNLWSVVVPTNISFPVGQVNYTVYANNSLGNEINMSSNFTIVESVNVTACGSLTLANTLYTMQGDISDNTITTDCIIVTAQNITFDCQSHYIFSIKNFSGVYSNQYNTTVKNCNITMGGWPTGNAANINAIGIELTDAADYSTVLNNTIIGGMTYGISFAAGNNGPDNSLIENNTIDLTNATGTNGIYLYTSSNNTLKGNNATSNSHGIYLFTALNNTLTSNTGIAKSTGVYGIYLKTSSNNTLTSNIGTSLNTTSSGIRLDTTSNSNNLTNNVGSGGVNSGIVLSAASFNTLTGNNGSSSVSFSGIFLTASSNNNNLTSNRGIGNSSYGIDLSQSSNNILVSNTGISNTSSGIILTTSSNNNNLTDNVGISNTQYGLYILSSSNNTLTNNMGTSNSSYGTFIRLSDNCTIDKIRAEGYLTSSYGLVFRVSNNTLIRDCVNVSGVDGDILYITDTSINNTFINCSYRTDGNNETVIAGGQLIRKWYYQAIVNDSNGNLITGANVSAFNVSGTQEFSILTNSSGWTNITEITEYVNNGGTRSYYSNYVINATNETLTATNTSYNVTIILNKLDNVFTLGESLDMVYPIFYNYWNNSPTNYGNVAMFNVSVNNTNGTVILSLNGANYTASNITSNVYNVSVSGLAVGGYNYNWVSYGNGSNHNYNVSDTKSFTVNPENSETTNLSEWRMFRRYLNHSAWDGVSYPTVSGLNNVKFSSTDPFQSSAAVVNGYVYLGSSDGQFYQLNATNIIHKIANFSVGITMSSPAVVNGFVYIGSSNQQVYQLNASNITQLIANFSADGDGQFDSSPAVANGYVYINCNNGQLYQLNASNVSQMIANFTTGGGASSPAVANGYVYVGGGDNQVYQLNESNVSQMIANFTVLGVQSSPAVWNGYVYIGSYDGNLYQLNASNITQEISRFTTLDMIVYSSPAVANGYVYIGSDDNRLFQLNASNITQEIAEFYTSGDIRASPSVGNGYVYVGSGGGYMYQFNATDISQPLNYYDVGSYIIATPAVTNDYIYFGDTLNSFYQLNASNISLENADFLPIVNLLSPTNTTVVYTPSQYFVANFSDNTLLKNSTFYIWNSTDSAINTTNQTVTGTANTTNISVTLPYADTFKWNYYACDISSNCGWNNTNFSLIYTPCPGGMAGLGTVASPCNVTNCSQLQNISLLLNANYSVINNINCSETSSWNSGAGFLPIGNATGGYRFSGRFFGNSKNITDLFIKRGTTNNIGLFGYVYVSSTVYGRFYDVRLDNVNISGKDNVGGLVGYGYYATINNSYATGNVNGTTYVGGLVGYGQYATINNSYATGNVTGKDYVGGLVGYGYSANISNSFSTGTVNGTTYVGGLVGYGQYATINNSYATGNVIGISNTVGGLVGYGYSANISNSFSTGTVNGTTAVGGLVGNGSSANISNSFSTGNVNGTQFVGGLVGSNDSLTIITNSYWNNLSSVNPNSAAVCVGTGTFAGCTAVQNNVAYFYNVSNLPMNVWNFVVSWDNIRNLIGFPPLRMQGLNDSVAPIVNITYPVNGTTYVVDVSAINYTIVDSYPYYCWWSNSTGVWNSSIVQAGTNWSGLTSVEGSQTWTVYCNDTRGNLNWSRVSFVKDTTAPNITGINITNVTGASGSGSSVSVVRGQNLTINATVSGAAYVWAKIWQGTVGTSAIIWQGLLNFISGNLWSVVVPTNLTFPTGIVNYTVYANDSLGNEMNMSSNFTIVGEGPVTPQIGLTMIYPTGNISVNQNNFFNVTLNSSCLAGNCGSVNTSIYVRNVSEVWNASYDGPSSGYDRAYGMAIDSLGNVYVTGVSTISGFENVYFTIKYNSSGQQIWNVSYNSIDDMAYGIAIDSNQNVYVTGYSNNGVDRDYYTIKYNSSGSYVSNLTYDSGSDDTAYGIAVDNLGNIYVTGQNNNGVDNDYFTIKYNSSGQQVWNATFDNGGYDTAYGIAVDNLGNAYVAGYSIGNGFSYIIKYNSTGGEIWNVNRSGYSYALTVDSSQNVYVAGSINDGLIYFYTIKYNSIGGEVWNATGPSGTAYGIAVDSSQNVYTTGYEDINDYDYVTIKYNSSGQHIWNETYSNTGQEVARAITLDTNQNVYVVGYIGDSVFPDYYTIKYNQYSLIPQNSGTPFYTNVTNPNTTTLSEGQSTNVVYWLNATSIGANYLIGKNYLTTDTSIYNWTNEIRIDTLDNILPVVNITYPQNTTYDINVSAINYTVTDNIGVSKCWWSNSSGTWNSTTQNPGINWTGLNSSVGTNTWSVYCNDSAGNLNFSSVSFTRSSNSPPTISLISPDNGNITLLRSPVLRFNASDAQSDELVYNINITCIGGCSADNRYIINYTTENYTVDPYLTYLYDSGYYYMWSVQACEKTTLDQYCSNWASYWIFNISSFIEINLTQASINFGNMEINNEKNTTNVSFDPLVVKNIGNCYLNISVNATSIWSSAPMPSNYFRAKIRNYTNNATWAEINWFQLPPITGYFTAVTGLNFSNLSNSLVTDISITAPGDEPPGNKSGEINFRASIGE